MNARFRHLRRGLLAVSLGVLALSATAVAAPLPGDDFEADDGNLVVDGATTTDWNAASPRVFFDLPTNADDTLTGGTQEVDHPSDWDVTISNNTNKKANILRSYFKSNSPYFRVGIVREQDPNGTTAYAVEFNQSTAKHANGLPVRTLGDALIIFDFQGNNVSAPITRHRWIDPGDCAGPGSVTAPCWSVGASLSTTQAIGANNTADVLDTVANPDETLDAATFDELAINLQTALGLTPNTCVSFGQVSIRSREGAAFGSALQDILGPLPISVGNCDVEIQKDVVSVNGDESRNPASVPFGATLDYRVLVSLANDSSPVAASQLTVTDTTISDSTLSDAALVPVRVMGVISGDDGDDVLEQGERWVYALSSAGATVTQTASSCDDVVNSARVVVTGGDINPSNNQATRTTPVACVPDIAIIKTGPASVAYGDTITYTVNVANVGHPVAIARADLDVTDPNVTAAKLEFASVVTGDGDTLLEKNEVWRYKLAGGGAVTVPANACAPIDNTAVVATLTGETNTANNTSTATTTVTCVPDIAITKSGPASVAYGATITYTVDVANVGHPLAIARADLDVTDPVVTADKLEFSAVITGDGDTLLEKNEVWRYKLAGGGAVTLPANACAPIDNTAVVATLTGETNTANNTSTATTSVVCIPDIGITKSGPAQVEKDGTISYTVRVTSIGHPLPIARADIDVTDSAVTESELVFSDEVSGNEDTYLDTGEVWEYRLSGGTAVTLPATACGNITNTALVAALTGETALANNSASAATFVRCPDYTVDKTAGAASVQYGAGPLGWSVTATNTGNVDLAIPALTDTTVTLTGPASSLDELDDPDVFQIDEVLTYTGTEQIAGRCGEISNTISATVMYGQIEITREGTATTTVVCIPDIGITKSGPASVDFGDTISYTVDVTSVGDPLPVARGDIHVTDPAVAGGTELVFSSVMTGNTNDLLEFGEVWRYRLAGDLAVTLPANRCTPIDNTAIVAVVGDGNAANNQSTVTTNVVCTLNLTIAKTSDKETYAAGETITYTVTVTNTGQAAVPFADITVSDPSLPALTLVGEAPAELAPQGVLTYTGTRATSIADCGTVPNTATVALAGEAQETTTNDNTATRNITVACTPNLTIAKSADKATYVPGEVITYTVTVHNTGQLPVPFGQIAVSDPTLPNLTLVGPAPTTLAVGASVSYTGTRSATAADCGNVPNTATVSMVGAAQAESSTADNSATVTVAVAGGACVPVVITGEQGTTLAIVKVGPRTSQVRRAVRYTLRVTNTGGSVARNVIVRDPVPSGMTVAKLPANATVAKRQLRWSIGDLQPGQSTTVSVLLRAEGNRTRRLCNTGFAVASNAAEVSSRACARFTRIAGVVRVPRVTG